MARVAELEGTDDRKTIEAAQYDLLKVKFALTDQMFPIGLALLFLVCGTAFSVAGNEMFPVTLFNVLAMVSLALTVNPLRKVLVVDIKAIIRRLSPSSS